MATKYLILVISIIGLTAILLGYSQLLENNDKEESDQIAQLEQQIIDLQNQIEDEREQIDRIDDSTEVLTDTLVETNDQHTQIIKTEYGNFFLVNAPENLDPSNVDQYLVAVKTELGTDVISTKDKIFYSLEDLFEIRQFEYGQSGYVNFLYASDLRVKDVTEEDGKFIINLEGEIVGIGAMADIFIKPQVTETIEQYSSNYSITLNGSEREWRCSLDKRGLCE